MNKTKQFWALLKFQATATPFLWIMPLVFATPLLFSLIISVPYVPDLSSLLSVQNLFFVGLLGVWVIAPEMNQVGATNSTWSPGTEFIITRAIDRPILYRARAALLYLLVLAMPLASLLHAVGKPDLKVTEFSAATRQECLSHVPGATLVPDPEGSKTPVISIPQGSLLVESWQFWQFVVVALGAQALLLSLYTLKHRVVIFYVLFMACIFAPLVFFVRSIGKHTPSLMMTLFFAFAAHPITFGALTVLALVVGELWCERRFASLEQ
jgi:hypothetical protein